MFVLFKGVALVASGIQYRCFFLRITTALLLCFSILNTNNQALAQALASSPDYDFFNYDVELHYEKSPYKDSFPVPAPFNPNVPTGYEDWGVLDDCSAGKLGQEIRSIGEDRTLSAIDITERIRDGLQNYFQRPLHNNGPSCGEELAKKGKHRIIDYSKMANIGYDYGEASNKNIREVRLDITTEKLYGFGKQRETIRGVLALQDGESPRPFVVVKCALMCAASTDYITKHILAHLFDQSSFNVLLLSNNTSYEYLLDNDRVSIGGMEEGQQLARILRWLRTKSSFKNKISSLHVVGMSQGGQTALYASIFLNSNDGAFNKGDNGEMLVNSNLALCPVINLRGSSLSAFSKSKASIVLTKSLKETLYEVVQHSNVPQSVSERFKNRESIYSKTGFRIIETLLDANADFHNDRYITPSLPPFTMSFNPDNAQEVFEANIFSTKYAHSRNEGELPTLIWSSLDDPIISYRDSGIIPLKENLKEYPDPKLYTLDTKHGQHCAFSLAYGWPFTTEVLRSYVYAHDRDFYESREVQEAELNFPGPVETRYPRYFHADQHWHWKWDGSKANLQLEFKILIPTGSCAPGDEGDSPNDMGDINAQKQDCYRKVAFTDISSENERWYEDTLSRKKPASRVEAEIETRWLNGNVKLFNQDGNKIKSKTDVPSYIRQQ